MLLGGSLIPYPAAKIVGGLLQLPDIYYDVKDNVNNPSSKTNWIHTVLDFGSQLRHLIPGQIDDIFFQIPRAIDDSYNVITGEDIIINTRRKLSSVFKNKRSIENKRGVENKKNNKVNNN